MSIIIHRIEKIFEEIKRNREFENFISKLLTNTNYHWQWQRNMAIDEINKQMNELKKEGYNWQIIKK